MSGIIATLLLAASVTTGTTWKQVVLDWGHLRMAIPGNATVTKERINWETDRYTVHRGKDGAELLNIIVGGGAMDQENFTRFCLNHERAWRSKQSRPVTVVVGHPGVDAVYLTSAAATESDTAMLNKMISSVKFFDGTYCR